METGNDGRFYDSHYDFNHNGRLDVGEQLLYNEDVYGKDSCGGSYRMRSRKSIGIGGLIIALILMGLFVFEFFIAVLCPPMGAILIYFTIGLKEKLL